MAPVVRQEREGAVALLTLARPQEGNPIDPPLVHALGDALDALAHDEGVRVVLVQGEGAVFSAGPFPPPGLLPLPSDPTQAVRHLQEWQAGRLLQAFPKPVVGAANGPAIGLGLELFLTCDLRLASTRAVFQMPHLRYGLLPWDGGSQRLSRIVGRAWAQDMLLTGREVDAAEALRLGLVHRVVAPEALPQEARTLAHALAQMAPIAARYAKEAVWQGLDLPLEHALRLEADLNIILQSTRDRAEGIRSFVERRRPTYEGR
ncbi:MAG: enoyl-CoA hydratase/isomerase family protein [Dehalococcoidia bacterium]|nr:enoyl-CoA hydratase/isomerase family protein [Dehalococcoidia bacterium]MDW8119917.1 enoyl-CoA hydratase/isomerase family protein [Chloroflexota bacterium]